MASMGSQDNVGSRDDALSAGPPLPSLRTSKSIPRHGSAASNDGGSRMLSLLGAHPAAVVANAMATIEQQVMLIQKAGAVKTAALLQSVIGQMRDVGAGELGDLAQGNTPDSGDSPPPGMSIGGPAPGMMPPPPPGPPPAAGGPPPDLRMVPFGAK